MIGRGSRLRVAVDGFTLLELAVVVCLVGIFAAVALDRFLRYQEIAEKAAMEATIGALRSAEAMQASARILRHGVMSVASLAEENPIDWLAAHPAGYRGALYDPGEADAAAGSWYFDLRNKELVYVPERSRFFTPGPDGRRQIRFRAIATVERDPRAGTWVLSELDVRRVSQGIWAPGF
jgi:prepilin-type N-terminal cleavage/methylation domain-containing protein